MLVLLAGCGSSSNTSSPTTARPTTTTATTTSTTAPPGSATTTTRPATTSTIASATTTAPTSATTSSAAQNLAITDTVRAQLLAAAEAFNSLPAGSYTALAAGTIYYGFDPATQTYWAGSGIVPSSTSQQAQVSVQDDGAYLLFSRPASSTTWKVYDDGLGGIGGTPCGANVPAALVALWGWPAPGCRPMNI